MLPRSRSAPSIPPMLGLLLVLLSPESRTLEAQDEYRTPELVGSIVDGRVNELSGMVASQTHPGVYWIHNDSDDTPRLFAIFQTGQVIGEVRVQGASADDWEDIALGAGPDPGKSYLYIADTGNNDLTRSTLSVYRIEEPELPHLRPGHLLTSAPATAIPFEYPDGTWNCEALVADPTTPDLLLITKKSGPAGVYRFPVPHGTTSPQTLLRLGEIDPGDLVTAADVTRDGQRALVRTYSEIFEFTRDAGAPFSEIFDGDFRTLPDANAEFKSESICFDATDREYLTSNEGNPAPIHRARRLVPQPHCESPGWPPGAFEFVRGDLVDTSVVSPSPLDIADLARLMKVLEDDHELPCASAADIDDDGELLPDDASTLASRLTLGLRPRPPFSPPDRDPTPDELSCHESPRETLVPLEATWSAWSLPGEPESGWKEVDFDDSAWTRGPGPHGFGRAGLGTVVSGVRTSHPAIFLRHVFTSTPSTADELLILRADYDDGFVAYLNGVEVVRRGTGLAGFFTAADELARLHAAGRTEEFVICPELLIPGENVLAVQVHNRSVSDSTLSFGGELLRRRPRDPTPPPTGGPGGARARIWIDRDEPLVVGDEAVLTLRYTSSVSLGAFSLVLDFDPSVLTSVRLELPAEIAGSGVDRTSTSTVRGQVSFVWAAADRELPPASSGEPGELLRWRILPRDPGTGETVLDFGFRDSLVPLETLAVSNSGELIFPQTDPLDLSLTLSERPFVRETVNAGGEAGDTFFILGNRLRDPGLQVFVCGVPAAFQVVQPESLLLVTAPECVERGWVEVRACNELGCSTLEEGFEYTGEVLEWIRGDVNGDGFVDISDPVGLLAALFQGVEATPACEAALDASNDTRVDITDAVYLLTFLFQGTVKLAPPYPDPAPCP